MAGVADTLFSLCARGVRLWSENGQLRYQAPRGALTAHDFDVLRDLRQEIITFCEQGLPLYADEPRLEARAGSDIVPLTFSQQWHWHLYDLGGSQSSRTVASAARLGGPLDVVSLQRSVEELVGRHESLRTRIVVVEGVPRQKIDTAGGYHLECLDMTVLPECVREIEAKRRVEALVSERYFVDAGPLFAATLLRLENHDHVLVVAMDHIISDAASVGIIWRELLHLYSRFAQGLPSQLPQVSVQFGDYAVWQRKAEQSWTARHAPYWQARLVGADHVRLFGCAAKSLGKRISWATLPVQFGGDLTVALREVSRREQTTLAMTVLTVYAALMMQWSGRTDIIVPFITMGRLKHEVQDTIGYFGTPLYLRITLRDGDKFTDLLRHVVREYAAAYEHDDSCRIAARSPRPAFAPNPIFNWIPEEFAVSPDGLSAVSAVETALAIEGWSFDIALRDNIDWNGEVQLNISDTNQGIGGEFIYGSDRVSSATLEHFAKCFLLYAEKFATVPHSGVAASSL